MILPREAALQGLESALSRAPVAVLIGPRQCGKTTLARQLLAADSPSLFDLEDPIDLARLEEPMTALGSLEGLVVIDEIQRRPDLFPILRVLVDRPVPSARFLILGSASGELMRQSSESLAGRMERIQLTGFGVSEVGEEQAQRLFERGGFPLAYLARSDEDSFLWRKHFIQTLLERDLPQWGVRVPATALHRFWRMVAHSHGQIWNAAQPARALGLSAHTVRRYLDILTDAMMLRQLQPWHANLKKRQVKSPKVYLRDSGLLHQLLGVSDHRALLTHPKLGSSWEGFVIEQVLASEPHDDAWFWATHQGAEIDLLLRRGDTLLGVEVKYADAPRMTRSMHTALEDLDLAHLCVVYPGAKRYPLAERVEVVPFTSLAQPGGLFPGAVP